MNKIGFYIVICKNHHVYFEDPSVKEEESKCPYCNTKPRKRVFVEDELESND